MGDSRESSLSESANDAYRFPLWFNILLAVVPAVSFLGLAVYYGPLLIDDAYITFRYAENIAAGRGMVYNPGVPVLGTTTVLFTVLLAVFKLVGLSVPLVARWLGILSAIAAIAVTQRLSYKSLGPVGAAALGICLAFHPDMAFAANSGMETCLSMVAVYGTLLLVLRSRYYAAGVSGGAAFLLRPDGALVLGLAAGYAFLRDRKMAARLILVGAVVVLPWLVYAAIIYGSPIPHSIKAKQLINPAPAPFVLLGNLRILTGGLPMKVACIFAVLGMGVALLRRSELLLSAFWMLCYLAGLSASRIFNASYSWYIAPLIPGVLLFAGYGINESGKILAGRLREGSTVRPWLKRGAATIFLVIMAALFINRFSCRHDYRMKEHWRVNIYLVVGDWLRERCAKGDTVLVGEVGTVGYVLPDQVIIDGSGINSPEVYRARKEDRERLIKKGVEIPPVGGSVDMILGLILEYRPRYVFTCKPWLHIEEIIGKPEIKKAYRRIKFKAPILGNFVILERKNPKLDN